MLALYCGSVLGMVTLFAHMLEMVAPIPQLLVFRGCPDVGRLDGKLIRRFLRAGTHGLVVLTVSDIKQ